MTFATDADVQLRAAVATTALDALNRWRAAQDPALPAVTLADYRDAANTEIVATLRRRGITAESITRPSDLLEPEVALTAALLCEAAHMRPPTTRTTQGTPDTFAEAGAWWRARYDLLIVAASPVDGVRGVGASFTWARG